MLVFITQIQRHTPHYIHLDTSNISSLPGLICAVTLGGYRILKRELQMTKCKLDPFPNHYDGQLAGISCASCTKAMSEVGLCAVIFHGKEPR